MQLMKVDPATYMPYDVLIEGYTSLIWTERFGVPGEFELKSPLINDMRVLLPEGEMVCILESDTVMMVETSVDGVNDDGVSEITIKGRTLETFLENRSLLGDYGVPWTYTQGEITVQDALVLYLWNSIANGTGFDCIHGYTWPAGRDPGDQLPNVWISETILNFLPASSTTPPDMSDLQSIQEWWLSSGQVFKQVQDFLNVGKLGLRIIRPRFDDTDTLTRINVNDGIYPTGTLHRDVVSPDGALRFDVYNAKNRTTTPTAGDYYYYPIIVRYDAGHMDSTNTLKSIKDWRNMAHISSSLGDEIDVLSDPTVVPPTGWARRHLYVDAGTIDDSVTDYDLVMLQKGQAALKEANKVTIVDGELSDTVPYSYPGDFALGTFITIVGKYGETEDMQITEWIRTEDLSGERAYPGLVIKE